jgi:hypothetical protein
MIGVALVTRSDYFVDHSPALRRPTHICVSYTMQFYRPLSLIGIGQPGERNTKTI